MNTSGMGGGFLSGYNGGFLGMNMLQQPEPMSNNAVHGHQMNHNNVQSSVSAKLGLEHEKTVGLMDAQGCMAYGKDKAVGPSNVVNTSNNPNSNTSDEDEPIEHLFHREIQCWVVQNSVEIRNNINNNNININNKANEYSKSPTMR